MKTQTNQTRPQNPINDLEYSKKQGYNTFNLSHSKYGVTRFGDISPILCLEGVPGDNLKIDIDASLRTYTFNAPTMFPILQNIDTFVCPIQAIIPNMYDKWLVTPKHGDDAQSSWIMPTISFNSNTLSELYRFDNSWSEKFKRIFLFYIIFSESSLCSYCGIKFPIIADTLEDIIIKLFNTDSTQSVELTVNIDSTEHLLKFTKSNISELFTTLQDSSFTIIDFEVFSSNSVDIDTAYYSMMNNLFKNDQDNTISFLSVLAYQHICANFYTNENIDNIYTSHLYNESLKSFIKNPKKETLNGVDFTVDACSHISDALFRCDDITFATFSDAMNYLRAIFCFNQSLRFQDYFLGSKLQPLAVGDVTIDVNNNKVSAVDVTKNISMQRFLNSVNRFSADVKRYTQDLFGNTPATTYPQPFFVSRKTNFIQNTEVENTSTKQGNLVSNNQMFSQNSYVNVRISEPSIILSLCSYARKIAFPNSTSKLSQKYDRYDFFNPMLQNIGDQPILLKEFDTRYSFHYPGNDTIFAYTQRYGDYKQAFSTTLGEITDDLKMYFPIFEYDSYHFNGHINDYIIRNHNSDLDKYYKSLQWQKWSQYFHFINSFDFNIQANRKMQYQSTIL